MNGPFLVTQLETFFHAALPDLVLVIILLLLVINIICPNFVLFSNNQFKLKITLN